MGHSNKKLSIKIANDIAVSRGGRCLSTRYTNVKSNLQWKCSNGHIWFACLDSIKNQGSWCNKCAIIKQVEEQKLNNPIVFASKIAQECNGRCLSQSDDYKNMYSKLKWKCHNNHTWEAPLHSIKYKKSWCPYCAGKHKHDIHHMKELAKSKGGKCLDDVYNSVDTTMAWQCSLGHEFYNSPGNIIYQDNWCPVCSGKSKTQKKLFDIVCDIFNNDEVKYNYRNFNWLRYKKTSSMEIDIFVVDKKLAIEYDGRQHFEPVDIFGGTDGYADTIERDRIKDKLIKEHKDDVNNFIRFNYRDKINKDNVLCKLKEFGISIGDYKMRKKMTHKLTDEQKEEIVSLMKEGFSPSDIAKKFEVSRTTVYNIMKKWKEEKDNGQD